MKIGELEHLWELPDKNESISYRLHLLYSIMWPTFLFTHIVYSIIFFAVQIKFLIFVSLISIVIYSLNVFLTRKRLYNWAVIGGVIEVSGFIALCTTYLGLEAGFQYWLFIIPMPLFLAIGWPRWLRFIIMCLIALEFGALYLLVEPVVNDIGPLFYKIFYLFNTIGFLTSVAIGTLYLNSSALMAERRSEKEHSRTESLLLNILPSTIAERLKANPETIADKFESCTIIFADIVGFTRLSSRLPANKLVAILNKIFSRFDELAEKHGLEKIKTIGDSYMAAGGLPDRRDDHAEAVINFALDISAYIKSIKGDLGKILKIRIGINSGNAIAGVIGKRKFIYDLWGDAVNIASRMESHGLPGEIQISEECYRQVIGKFRIEERGLINVKGKGQLKTYLVKGT